MSLISFETLDVDRWRRIESVLDLVFDADPSDVAAVLDRECAGRPELRREVEALLDADRRATSLMATPAAALVGPIDDAIAEETLPERIGRYVVTGVLGRGGMGVVYEGRDPLLERTVAIKALPEAFASDPDRLGRFLAEARLLGVLHHPNLAAIHGIEHVSGRRYLVLERVEGTTLADRLDAGALALPEALDVATQLAEALAAAHAQGVIHRDLKPANVMLTPSGLLKLLDLGLAVHDSAAGEALPADPRSSTTTVIAGHWAHAGSPGYMSPEQILALPQDARTDLFAFGAVLYQCLTGRRPFPGGSVREILAATLDAPADFDRLPAETPAPVRELIVRALDKEPAQRLASAGEAVAVLAALGDRAPAWSARPDATSARVPEMATLFVGRERELAALARLLERSRVVTLTGAGGCGKSRLARELVGRRAQAGLGRVWFAELATAADPAGIDAAVAAAAGLRNVTEERLVDALEAASGGEAALLVLDHCEHLLAQVAAFVARLATGAPHVHVVATSREWLGVAGEQTMRVPPLAVPAESVAARAATIRESEAVKLFLVRARVAQRDFALTDANAALVAAICRDLDGVPLALELAAALLRSRPLEAIAHDLERRLRGDGGGAGADAGHDTLPAAIQLSYDRLVDDERRFFRALSVFTGGWSLESAAAIGRDDGDVFAALDLLTRLLDKSLVVIERADRLEPRYRFLEPIRHFASVRTGAEGEIDRLRERHGDWFLASAERLAPSLTSGAAQAKALAWFEAEHANVLSALRHAPPGPAGTDGALRLAGATWWFWYVRGHFTRGRDALAHVLAMPGAEAPSPARALALFAAGGLAVFQGDYAQGRVLSRAALDAFAQQGDTLGTARAMTHLALCESGEGRYDEAEQFHLGALGIFREKGDGRRLCATLNNLGVLARQRGDFRAALTHHEEALPLFRVADDRDGTVVTLVNLGLASARLGESAAAGRWLDDALTLIQELRARRAGAAAMQVVAEVLAGRGAAADAARLVGAAGALRTALGLSADAWWQRTQDALAERLRAALGEREFESFTLVGGALDFDAAIAEARRGLSLSVAASSARTSSGESS